MTPDQKTRWVDALRSGCYPQGRGALQELESDGTSVGYCCLGVACVALLEGSMSASGDEFTTSDGTRYSSVGGGMNSAGNLVYLLDLGDGDLSTLIHMNDDEESSFNDIATWIEDHL